MEQRHSVQKEREIKSTTPSQGAGQATNRRSQTLEELKDRHFTNYSIFLTNRLDHKSNQLRDKLKYRLSDGEGVVK